MIRTEIKLIIVYLTKPSIIITISIDEANNSYALSKYLWSHNKLSINYFNRLMHKSNNNSRKENSSKNDCK